MKMHQLQFDGHYEDEARIREPLQLLEGETSIERDLVSWSILAVNETVDDDAARRGYVFEYALGGYLDRGLYRLKIHARDASGGEWGAEIAAAMTVTPSTGAIAARTHAFAPMWFISERLHFQATQEKVRQAYPGECYGRLDFTALNVLPHNRLFGAAVQAGPRRRAG